MRRQLRGLSRDERGGATLELVMIAPVMLAVMMLLVAFGRVTTAQGYIDQASRDAARVAVAQRSNSQAEDAARASAQAAMEGAPQSCHDSAVPHLSGSFGASDPFDPHGVNLLTVEMTCNVSLSDLTFLPVAGDISLSSTFSSPMSSIYGVYGNETGGTQP